MQYRLSTLLLIFFVVAASLAAFGVWGIWSAGLLCFAALRLNRASTLGGGIVQSACILGVGFLFCGPVFLMGTAARDALRREWNWMSLHELYYAIADYSAANKHYPPTYVADTDGKPLRSWQAELLPYLNRDDLYQQMRKDEPWNSPHNARLFDVDIAAYVRPDAKHADDDHSTNYLAIIGPGTIWRADGALAEADIAENRSNTIIAIETADSGKHWAEPVAIAVDEVLKNMKSGAGPRIAARDRNVVFVLTADGQIHFLPTKMSLNSWRKVLEGKADLAHEAIEANADAPDAVDVRVAGNRPQPGNTAFVLSVVVWLLSAAWLCYRAVKSRKVIPSASADTR
jgi:hypothetical protein